MSVWDKLVDQEQISNDLINFTNSASADNGHAMANSWLFLGDSKYNTNLAALAFACQLLCETNNACGECPKCLSILKNEHSDVFILRTSKVSIKIDDLRVAIETADVMPRHGKYRIMIVEDASRIDETTQDVLLKSIEEPQPHTIWILTSRYKQDLLPTICSRSRIITFKIPSLNSISSYLINNYQANQDYANVCASLCLGDIDNAVTLNSDPELLKERETIAKIPLYVNSITDSYLATDKIFSILEKKVELLEDKNNKDEVRRVNKDSLNLVMQIFLEVFRDIYTLKMSGDEEKIVNKHMINTLRNTKDRYSLEKLGLIVDQNIKTLKLIENTNVNLKLAIMSFWTYLY